MRVPAAFLALLAAAAALAAPSPRAPTFHGQVDRILRRHCDVCHRPGDIGPMALDDYATAADHADEIVTEVLTGRMPPWRATRGIGRFADEKGLSAKEIDVLLRWRAAGAPQGAPPTKGKPVSYPDGWVLGEPDAVLDYGEAFTVPAGGDDVYRCFPIRNPFGRTVRLSGIDVKPGNRGVLHHVVMYVDSTGATAALDDAEPGPGYVCFGGPGTPTPIVLGGWAPGNRARFFPRGTAMTLGKDDVVVVQCHYHAGDEDETDRTTIGLFESDDPSPAPVFLLPVLNDTFTIPAGNPAYPVEALLDPTELTGGIVQVSGFVHAVLPHMHLLGKTIAVDLLLPDGTEQRLVEILDWDFDWQETYALAKPVPLPPGTKFRVRAVYDNSELNEDNPNAPPRDVSYGERTTDEMCLAFLEVTFGAAKTQTPPTIRRASLDAPGRLVVTAKGLGVGGRIEIGGVALRTEAFGRNRLRTVDPLPIAVNVGNRFDAVVRVRRTDGRLSPPFDFTLLF